MSILSPAPTATPVPTAEQQRVLHRIALQRQRLRAAHARSLVTVEGNAAAGADESLARSTIWFVREHPWAVTTLVALAAVAGPRRLIRWTGVLLPMLLRLRRRPAGGGGSWP